MRVVQPLVLNTEYAMHRHKAGEVAQMLRVLGVRSVFPRIVREAGDALEACKSVLYGSARD